jgi:predicted nucleic acid-binding protein
LVVDASIATKWFLNDEEFAYEADALLRAFHEETVSLYAPDHIRYEVGNALRNAVRRERITDAQGRRALSMFLAWQIPTTTNDDLIRAAYDHAIEFDCAFYDGLYLALASETGTPLVHADQRLRNTLIGRFDLELWIGNLELPPEP